MNARVFWLRDMYIPQDFLYLPGLSIAVTYLLSYLLPYTNDTLATINFLMSFSIPYHPLSTHPSRENSILPQMSPRTMTQIKCVSSARFAHKILSIERQTAASNPPKIFLALPVFVLDCLQRFLIHFLLYSGPTSVWSCFASLLTFRQSIPRPQTPLSQLKSRNHLGPSNIVE